jgi:hypothetical protein
MQQGKTIRINLGQQNFITRSYRMHKKTRLQFNNERTKAMRAYQGWEIESPQSNAGCWSVILNHKHSHRTHFINLESSMTLRSVEDLIYTTIEKLIEEENKR